MRIRLEKEKRLGEEFAIKTAVEIESDDPSWAMRKAKELLDAITGEEITGELDGSDLVVGGVRRD